MSLQEDIEELEDELREKNDLIDELVSEGVSCESRMEDIEEELSELRDDVQDIVSEILAIDEDADF